MFENWSLDAHNCDPPGRMISLASRLCRLGQEALDGLQWSYNERGAGGVWNGQWGVPSTDSQLLRVSLPMPLAVLEARIGSVIEFLAFVTSDYN